ncbi:MAG: hypothetical protein RMZ42_06190 [Nostoc sp. DedQUE05]|uniref:ornithine carbamoyltransferase n=1 Tax=Nostoc sp. DedQUE05 TaxID=3075391 RepID=UPI002AD53001|nr:hypothetical protein [Nostoc sp. DedQUE05]MDZ8091515.1 hypothetical protein [Nostoc sp. DedQUE05]
MNHKITSWPVTPCGAVKHEYGLISLSKLSNESMIGLLRRSCDLHSNPNAHSSPLTRRSVGILFSKTSTRTRTAFTVATIRLGGTPVMFGPADLQTNTGESLEDTGKIFASMLDLLVVRTAGPTHELHLLSGGGLLPVINAMTTEEHPTQGICDLATMWMNFGSIEGLRVLYIGEGNNTATALARGLTSFKGCQFTVVTPPEYGLPTQILEECTRKAKEVGGAISQTYSLVDLPDEVDVVYTTRWQTTGTTKSDFAWREVFRPYYIDENFMQRWPKAVFMHDLPAHRGEEVSTAVLEGKQSLVWLQASMKLSSAMAILEYSIQRGCL